MTAHTPSAQFSPPGPSGLPLLGSLIDIWRDRLDFLCTISQQYDSLVQFRMGPKVFYLVNQPDDIKHVLQENYQNYHKGIGLDQAKSFLGNGLLTNEGVSWRQQRRRLQPALHRQRVAAFVAPIVAATTALLERWAALDQRGQPVDIVRDMMRLTLHGMSQALLGTDISSGADAIGAALMVVHEGVARRMMSPIDLPAQWPTPRNLRFRRALDQLDAWVYTLIERRRQQPGRDDVLDLLLDIQHDDMQPLTVQAIRDEIVTLLFAGHETTASTLAWTLLLIAQHPPIAQRLQAEVDEVLGGQLPSAADLPQLSFSKMIICEALRLYPPVWLIPRRALQADQLSGYAIPPGANLLISPYALHRHPRLWEAPEQFIPDRFANEQAARRPSFAYLPFGRGPRHCIGNHMGMIEAQLVVAMIAQRYHLRRTNAQAIIPEPTLSLHPRGQVLLTVEAR